jgi:hypothetical protein
VLGGLPVRQPLLPLLGPARPREREPHARDRDVVRRVLLPARPQARAVAAHRRRREPRLRPALRDRPARRGASPVPRTRTTAPTTTRCTARAGGRAR